MPAEDSRVGIIGFNTSATVWTEDTSGNASLISLANFTGVETVREAVAQIVYHGDTGIGNALYAATELLAAQSDEDHTQAIILFTDGVNDFGSDQIALAQCDENEATAIQWAKENDCVVYCVGYDYITSSGASSMGENGEGLLKLQNIADSTGGMFQAISTIDEIEDMLITFLADVCDLNYKIVETIPGDGGYHECIIPVSASVIEANIRIAGGDENAIANGSIHLYDPNGDEVELTNSGNVRFDTDATAASIKVILPQSGDWLLTVDGITGDDIQVGLLEHFKMNLTSQLTFPEGNPTGVAYTNDTIGIKTWLTYDGEDLTDSALYDSVTSAVAVCVSRADPDDQITVNLTRDGNAFTGSFVIPEDSYYDIYIRLDWDTVYREDQLTVMSSNKPLTLLSGIEDVEVNKGKSTIIDYIYQYVYDDEGDAITAAITGNTNPDAADIVLNGDTIEVTGLKMTSTIVTVQYTDAQGNTVETSFKLTVHNPWVYVYAGGTILLIALAVILVLILLKKATNRLSGGMKVIFIARGKLDRQDKYTSQEIIYENPNIDHDTAFEAESASSRSADDLLGGTGSFNSTGNPFDTTGSPFGTAGNPFGSGSSASPAGDPFGAGSDSFGSAGDPFGSGSNPFGSASDPFTSGGTLGSDNGFGDFGGTSESGSTNGLDFGATDGGFGDFPGFGTAQATEEAPADKGELTRSQSFDEKIMLGRVKKKNMDKVLHSFLEYYGEFMTFQNPDSPMYRQVRSFVEQNLMGVFARFHLRGTTYGKFGVVLQIDKQLLKSAVKVHNPTILKNKASMNPKQRPVRLSVSVFTGERDEKTGDRPCAHIEIEYSKNT